MCSFYSECLIRVVVQEVQDSLSQWLRYCGSVPEKNTIDFCKSRLDLKW